MAPIGVSGLNYQEPDISKNHGECRELIRETTLDPISRSEGLF